MNTSDPVTSPGRFLRNIEEAKEKAKQKAKEKAEGDAKKRAAFEKENPALLSSFDEAKNQSDDAIEVSLDGLGGKLHEMQSLNAFESDHIDAYLSPLKENPGLENIIAVCHAVLKMKMPADNLLKAASYLLNKFGELVEKKQAEAKELSDKRASMNKQLPLVTTLLIYKSELKKYSELENFYAIAENESLSLEEKMYDLCQIVKSIEIPDTTGMTYTQEDHKKAINDVTKLLLSFTSQNSDISRLYNKVDLKNVLSEEITAILKGVEKRLMTDHEPVEAVIAETIQKILVQSLEEIDSLFGDQDFSESFSQHEDNISPQGKKLNLAATILVKYFPVFSDEKNDTLKKIYGLIMQGLNNYFNSITLEICEVAENSRCSIYKKAIETIKADIDLDSYKKRIGKVPEGITYPLEYKLLTSLGRFADICQLSAENISQFKNSISGLTFSSSPDFSAEDINQVTDKSSDTTMEDVSNSSGSASPTSTFWGSIFGKDGGNSTRTTPSPTQKNGDSD